MAAAVKTSKSVASAGSTQPVVELVKAFSTPFSNAIATARTCYSGKGIVLDSAIDLTAEGRDRAIAESIYQAGHHTTFQHAQFQFALSAVSRQFIWSFLHSHPFYNSEQVSQRYVRLKPDAIYMPQLSAEAREVYLATVEMQLAAYRSLRESLFPTAEAEYFRLFPARGRRKEEHRKSILKITQEAARYVAPIATLAHLYHTVSGVTLLRYWRICEQGDVPLEQRRVVELMVNAVLAHDPQYNIVLQEPLNRSDFALFPWLEEAAPAPQFAAEFDASLEGRTSRLIDYKANAEQVVADSVREVLGRPRAELSDDEAIKLALDPTVNTLYGETLNLTTHDKLARTANHPGYTFRKKLSHAADSQDQRHRMTPGSRPALATQISGDPDYITPTLVLADEPSRRLYDESMARTWEGIGRLKRMGVSDEEANYLLPNAVAVRFTESADLLNLLHKHHMRLCYNAQEEIWRASIDEAQQVREVHPRLGRFLLPPCTPRHMAGAKPICPEGDRYCGVKVWQLDLSEYQRLI